MPNAPRIARGALEHTVVPALDNGFAVDDISVVVKQRILTG